MMTPREIAELRKRHLAIVANIRNELYTCENDSRRKELKDMLTQANIRVELLHHIIDGVKS